MKALFSGNAVFATAIILMGLSLVVIFSASGIIATQNYDDSFYFIKRQTIFVLLGAVAMALGYKLPVEKLNKYAYHIYFFSLLLLGLVLIPGIGTAAGGAQRWISLKIFNFQPGEFFKFTLVVYLAMSLAKKGQKMSIFRIGIVPHLVLPGMGMALLLLEPDFGTVVLTVSVTFTMLFIGGARVAYLLGAVMLAGLMAFHLITSSPYRLQRVTAFFDPWAHRQDIGYQIVQSLLSLGSGKFSGSGVGEGASKLHFLPAAHTDFIFSVIGEEYGFLGASFVIGCFLLIALIGFKTAFRLKSTFHRFLAAGITATLVLQAIINLFVVLGVVPTKGMTLPLVSYGGTSLITCCFMIGLLLQLIDSVEETKRT